MTKADSVRLDNFNAWLITMDVYLNNFRQLFPLKMQSEFDYTSKSLEALEQWLLKEYASSDALLEDSEKDRLNCIACYIGETFRKAIGAAWTIKLDDPDNVYYGLPVIVAKGKASICPITMAATSVTRRNGSYLKTAFEIYVS